MPINDAPNFNQLAGWEARDDMDIPNRDVRIAPPILRVRAQVDAAQQANLQQNKQKFHIEWGGADLDPSFYGIERSLKCGRSFIEKDKESIKRIKNCIDQGIPIIGICRGAQILNVVNGGILVQHIDGHTRHHSINLFDLNGIQTHTNIKVSSTHHQMMIAHEDGHIIGKDPRPATGMHWEHVNEPYIYKYVTEVVYYPQTKSLCIQPHPEWMDQNSDFVKWINEFIKEYMGLDPIDFKAKELEAIFGM